MQYVRKRAWQKIKPDTKKSTECSGGKALLIVKGSLVLLWDHPEEQNKIQDNFKYEQCIIIGLSSDPNVYNIRPVNGDQLRKVNRLQL